MISDKLRPGMYGYIDYCKKKQLIFSVVIGVIMIALIITGLLIFGTTKNLIMIPALLFAIPFAMFFSSYVAKIKYKTADREKYDMLGNFANNDMLLSDLIFVDADGTRFHAEFAVLSYGSIKAFASVKHKDQSKIEIYLNEQLKKRGTRSKIKFINDFDKYKEAVNSMKIPETDEEKAEIKLAKESLILSCM